MSCVGTKVNSIFCCTMYKTNTHFKLSSLSRIIYIFLMSRININLHFNSNSFLLVKIFIVWFPTIHSSSTTIT